MRGKKIKLLNKKKTTAIGKSFMQNQIKSRQVTKFRKILTLNICNEAKQTYQKKRKKASKKRYSTSFTSSHPKVSYKKGVFKNFVTCLFAYY